MGPALADMDIPDLTQNSVEIDMDGGSGSLPADLQLLMRNADVTTIVERSVTVAEHMFDQQKPARVAAIQAGVDEAVATLEEQLAEIPDMPATAAAREEMATTVTQLEELSAAVPGAFDQAKEDYVADLRADGPALEATFQHELNMGFVNLFWFYGATALPMLVLLLFIPSRQDL